MRKRYLFIALILSVSYNCYSQNVDSSEIISSMQMQVKAWNEGNIEEFMQTYWNSDSLIFIGQNGVTYGWHPTLERYKQNYSDTAIMGKLQFSDLQLEPLSNTYYFVIGKWHLQRTIGDIGGVFSLLFKKINGKWLIIADHSS